MSIRLLLDEEKEERMSEIWNMTEECFPEPQTPLMYKVEQCVRKGDVWMYATVPLLPSVGHAIVTEWGQQTVKIRQICVREQWRGKGIGGEIIDLMKVYYKNKGMTKIFLDVRQDNGTAQRLYLRQGFRFTRVLVDKYGPGEDGAEMETTL
jgi:ribosomal protein S18 acetylase RimI-like enzyme